MAATAGLVTGATVPAADLVTGATVSVAGLVTGATVSTADLVAGTTVSVAGLVTLTVVSAAALVVPATGLAVSVIGFAVSVAELATGPVAGAIRGPSALACGTETQPAAITSPMASVATKSRCTGSLFEKRDLSGKRSPAHLT